jgi:hypothetical protein
MENHLRDESDDCVTQSAADEMAAYGITRVPVEYFHYRGFRYTTLLDAIAQARRELPAVQKIYPHIKPLYTAGIRLSGTNDE